MVQTIGKKTGGTKELTIKLVKKLKHDFNFKQITSDTFKSDVETVQTKMMAIPNDINYTITAIKNEVERYDLPAVRQFTLYQHFKNISSEIESMDCKYNPSLYLTLSWLKIEIEKYPSYTTAEFENQLLLQMQLGFIKDILRGENPDTDNPYFEIYFDIDGNDIVLKEEVFKDLEKQIKNFTIVK